MCFFFLDWRSEVSRDQRPRHAEPAVPSGSGVLQEFDGDVSPWNTRESMRTSDDVAQLLVSYGIVIVSMKLMMNFREISVVVFFIFLFSQA